MALNPRRGEEGAQVARGKAQLLTIVGPYADVTGCPLIITGYLFAAELQAKAIAVGLAWHISPLVIKKGVSDDI